MQVTRQLDGGAWCHLVVKVGMSVAATFRCSVTRNGGFESLSISFLKFLIFLFYEQMSEHEVYSINKLEVFYPRGGGGGALTYNGSIGMCGP